jgi:hypothetical protein
MASINIAGETSGTLTLSAPLVAGSNTVTLPAATGTISLLARATAVASTSGTSIDFTSIPSWAKRITVMYNGVSVSGTSNLQVQLGDSGGIETSGYIATSQSPSATTTSTSGFIFTQSSVASDLWYGQMIISAISSTAWAYTAISNNRISAGTKTLSDILTQVRITTVNGTDTFDAGSINVMWEG